MLFRIWTMAYWTAVEMLRERVLYVVLLFVVLLVASSSILTPLAPGAQRKVVIDFGLAAIDILSVLVILLSGATLIRRDIDRRCLDVLLARPLSRLEYLFGKCLGVVITLAILMTVMTGIFALTLQTSGFGWEWSYLQAILASVLQTLVVASLAVLFSTFTSPTLAALFTLALFVAGHLTESILKMAAGSASAAALERLTWLVPALGLFNLRGDVVYGVDVPLQRLLVIAAYAGLYAVTALYASALVFRRRDLR